MGFSNYGAIRSGVACVGTATVGGNPNFMGAAYTYTASSGLTYGHAELGSTGGSCVPGITIANETPDVKLFTNQFGEILWGPRRSSADWTSTWQYKTGGGHTAFGTVCGYY